MSDIDFALNWQFIDPQDGCPRQLRFRRTGGDLDPGKDTGQLIAVVADGYRSDNGHTITLSRDGVTFADVDHALDGWDNWAMITDTSVNLAEIRRRIDAAGLS